jgi:hypothetical protein
MSSVTFGNRSRRQLNTFIEACLDPLPDEAIVDTAYNALERQARKGPWRKVDIATCYTQALLKFTRMEALFAKEVIGDTTKAAQCRSMDGELVTEHRRAVANQIRTPAPSLADVAWKRQAAKDKYLPIKPEDIEAIIASDLEWLAAHPVTRQPRRPRRKNSTGRQGNVS